MANLSISQIYNLALSVGFTPAQAVIATAIALAESGGNPQAQHTNGDGTIDRGLWQINNHWHPNVSDACAYDAACNASNAYWISQQGTNWGAWATYTSGAYKAYLSAVQQIAGPAATAGGGPIPDSAWAPGGASASGTPGQPLNGLGQIETDIVGFVLGAALALAGGLIVAAPAIKQVGKVAVKAAI